MNKKSATEIGDEAVTQKKKSSELPKRDMEGSEFQKIGRPAIRDENIIDEFKVTSKRPQTIALIP